MLNEERIAVEEQAAVDSEEAVEEAGADSVDSQEPGEGEAVIVERVVTEDRVVVAAVAVLPESVHHQ